MILRKMLDAEGWIIGSPVYLGGMTSQLKTLIDRTHSAQPCGRAWRNKVCGIITMAAQRAGGAEATMDDIRHWLMNIDAINVGPGPARPSYGCGSFWGAAGVQGWPQFIDTVRKEALNAVKQDHIGIGAAGNLGRRVAEMAKVIKAGFASLGEGETAWPYGPLRSEEAGLWESI
jgi:multimeric flavodoxin WrbA